MRDLARFLPLKSHSVSTRNVRDLQIRMVEDLAVAAPLDDVLSATLHVAGYSDMLRCDPMAGFSLLRCPDGTEGDAAAHASAQLAFDARSCLVRSPASPVGIALILARTAGVIPFS